MNESIFKDTMVEMSWKQIEEKGKSGVPVLLPLGVIEEHGPHLPLGTDIYMSYMICNKIRNLVIQAGRDCIIAPPYYWGINKCTGAFPGSFSVRPETMKMMLQDIFENLKQFGFQKIVCINQHGDPLHNKTILEAIKETSEQLQIDIKYFVEPYDLDSYGLSGKEEFCLVDEARYPEGIFMGAEDKLDIHAGVYETASMASYYPKLLNEEIARKMLDYSLSYEDLGVWLEGGEGVKQVVPCGYAGDPASFESQMDNMKVLFDIMCKYIADQM